MLETEWTDQAISEKLRRQREMERRVDPAFIAKSKREGLEQRLAEAREKADDEEVARLEAELEAVVNMYALNGGVKHSPVSGKKIAGVGVQQERLAQLNLKNRGKNAEEVRRALIEEKKRHTAARELALVENKAKAEKKEREKQEAEQAKKAKSLAVPGAVNMADLFGEGGGSDVSRAGTPGVRSRAGTPGVGEARRAKKEGSGLASSGMGNTMLKKGRQEIEEEVLGGLDLGIDVEI